MKIGRKLYYDKLTGNIIIDTGEKQGHVVETTIAQDFQTYRELKERVCETVGCLKLEWGQYKTEFLTCTGFRINLNTKEIEFDFTPEQNEENEQKKNLQEQIQQLTQENLELRTKLETTAEAIDFIILNFVPN